MKYFIFTDCKCLKLVMQQNPKNGNPKEPTATGTTKAKPERKVKIINKCPSKLPKLLPITNMKKGIYICLDCSMY